MKVDPTRRVTTPAIRRTGKTGEASGSSFAGMLDGAAETSGTGATLPTTSIDALIAVQQVDADQRRGKQEAQRQAEDLLQRLERIRDGLLLGAIPRGQLQDLAQAIGRMRTQQFTDPRLAEILAEIELRARVELAKLGTYI